MSRGMSCAVGARPEAGLHRMRDQRLDLDDLAALGVLRHIDQGAWPSVMSSRQAAERDDHVGAVRPERAVADLGDGDDLLRIGKPDAGAISGLAGARPELDAEDMRLRVLLVEDVDRLDVVGFASSGSRPTPSAARCCRSRPAAAGRAHLALATSRLRRPPCGSRPPSPRASLRAATAASVDSASAAEQPAGADRTSRGGIASVVSLML